MKKELHYLFYNAEALMLLAEYLHKVLLRSHLWEPKKVHKKHAKCDKRFEEVFTRLQKIIDYKADSADALLRCKIKEITRPQVSDTVCIRISPAHTKSVIKKNCITKKERKC